MAIALPRVEWPGFKDADRWLGNWLLCWILLPNLGYWLLWIIGGPPRPVPILLTGALGIITHRAPFAVRIVAFLAAMVMSVLFFVSALFNLSIQSLVHSLQFAAELRPSASIEYVVCGAVIVGTIGLAWRLLRRPMVLAQPRKLLLAGLCTWCAASADVAMSEGNRGSYKRLPDPGAPFTSAVESSGLAGWATGERHLVIVMVEAMGQPADPAQRRRLVDLWAPPAVRARYDVAAGETLFYGSTTNAEIRELCGRWGDYPVLREKADPSCLPARLAARGYETQAWHSFAGTFFERTDWYPNVGFSSARFGPDLVAAGAEGCPGVFPGACDRDVPAMIGAHLRRADRPQFLYWLTVNSHLPVPESGQLHTSECERFDPRLGEEYPMVCRLFQLFGEVGSELAREIAAPDFPATDILIVGDHIPPFFDRGHREQFEPDRVPWILLRPKLPAAAERFAAR